MDDVNDLEFEIPDAENQATEQDKKGKIWNPQPDHDKQKYLPDKQGNAFEHQAIICKQMVLIQIYLIQIDSLIQVLKNSMRLRMRRKIKAIAK